MAAGEWWRRRGTWEAMGLGPLGGTDGWGRPGVGVHASAEALLNTHLRLKGSVFDCDKSGNSHFAEGAASR